MKRVVRIPIQSSVDTRYYTGEWVDHKLILKSGRVYPCKVLDTAMGWYKHAIDQWNALGRVGSEPVDPLAPVFQFHEIEGEEEPVFTRENHENLIDFIVKNRMGNILPAVLDEPFSEAP